MPKHIEPQWISSDPHVYFVQGEFTGLIKIGFTNNPKKRWTELGAQASEPIRFLATLKGDMDDEKKLHLRFKQARVHGEWFLPNEELLRFINSICDSEIPEVRRCMGHFPKRPVMPGVMMIEAITQSAAWLIRVTERFRHSVILLKEAKTVKFGQFVTPGQQLRVECQQITDDGRETVLKAKGLLDGKTSVSAKVILTRFNLRDRDPVYRRDDQRLKAHHLRTYQMLATPQLRERLREVTQLSVVD